MGNSANARSRRCEEDAAGECAPPTPRRRQASGTLGGLSCCRGLRRLLRRARRSRAPPTQSSTVAAQQQGCHAPNTQEQTSTSRSSRAVLQISAVHVEKNEHGAAPTMLTVGYKGWWHTPKVHLRLTLERVAEVAPWGPQQQQQQQQQPGAGEGRLQQWFPPGRGPTLRVKGHARTLALRLYTGRRLTAQAEAPLGELLSRTAEGAARVPLKVVKEGGAVQVAWVEVTQISPRPTPLPPPRWPLPFPSQDQLLPPHHLVFPPAQEPTSFRLKQLVRDMYGAPSDDTDWSKPFQFSREASPAGDATTTTTTTCPPTPASTASTTHTASTARTSAITSSTALPEATSRCRRALRFVLQCLLVLICCKIATDVMLRVYWAFLGTTQDTERGLAWTPFPPH